MNWNRLAITLSPKTREIFSIRRIRQCILLLCTSLIGNSHYPKGFNCLLGSKNTIYLRVNIYPAFILYNNVKMTEMKEIKRKFFHNSIKLCIGIILLFMSHAYIKSHPAEEISFFSGFKVIYQTVEIFFQNLIGNNGDILKQKYAIEDYLQVLISLSEEKHCVDAQLIQDLHDTYDRLLAEPKSTLSHTLEGYIQKQFEFDQALRIDCDTQAEPFPIEVTDLEQTD
jgi:hypothetical protein